MKKIVFVCSHLQSGSRGLCNALDLHPRIQMYDSTTYQSSDNLILLTKQHHKLNNRSAIYMNELIHNHQLCTKAAYANCKFIYVIRSPEITIGNLVEKEEMKLPFAIRYYTYRLRRICEMAKRTPGAVLLTWDDLNAGRGINLIDEYLELKQGIIYDPMFLDQFREENDVRIKLEEKNKLEETYQKYLYWLKTNTLLRFYS